MDIDYLYEFTVIAKLESFSRAAEELCISQSALSKHMQALERELGVNLLIRNSRNVNLSPAGSEILPMAAEMYALKNRIQVAADRQSGRDKTLLSIGSIPVMAQYNITGVLARFRREHPEVTLEVRELEQQDLRQALDRDECSMAFSRLSAPPEEDLEYLPFCRDYLVAVLPVSHPLSGQSGLTLEELQHQSLLFLDSRTGLHALCDQLFQDAGLTPRVIYTGHRPENIVELSAQQMGIALLMKRHTDYVRNPDVVCIPLEPRVESTVCLVRRKDRKPSALARRFWDFVRTHSDIHAGTE